jgi:hypothetical protein
MKNSIVTENPVVLEGYQAVLKPSKFGYSLSAIVDEAMVKRLEDDREEALGWAKSKLKNPRRSTLKPEPWIESEETPNMFRIKFTWNEQTRPPVVDTEGAPITDENTPLFSGSQVKLAFFQKPYILKDGETYGTSLKIQAIQVISLNGQAGVDVGDMSHEAAAALFGQAPGFKQSEPNVVVKEADKENFSDFEF